MEIFIVKAFFIFWLLGNSTVLTVDYIKYNGKKAKAEKRATELKIQKLEDMVRFYRTQAEIKEVTKNENQ